MNWSALYKTKIGISLCIKEIKEKGLSETADLFFANNQACYSEIHFFLLLKIIIYNKANIRDIKSYIGGKQNGRIKDCTGFTKE